MRRVTILCIAAVILVAGSTWGADPPPYTYSLAQAWNAQDSTAYTFSLWLGGHATEFDKYRKKVGEYNLGINEVLPEVALQSAFRQDGSQLLIEGHFYDDANAYASFDAVVGRYFNLRSQYRSLVRQLGQDQLTNLNAKEAAGGKILSHEFKDPGADYSYNREELTSKMQLLLSPKGNLRLVAAHRSITKNGSRQALSTNHCWGCHAVSQEKIVDNRTDNAELGLDATVKGFDFGYQFGYRHFKSDAPEPHRYYDTASHPIDYTNPGTQAEFGSRLVFNDTVLNVQAIPETEKMAHKLRFKGRSENSNLTAVLSYANAENLSVGLQSKSYNGIIKYGTRLSRSTQLLARLSVLRLQNDDPFVGLPIFRDGRPGPPDSRQDFSFTRYSALDRWDTKLDAEVVSRLNPLWTLYVQGAYHGINRDDYITQGDGLNTTEFFGQAKIKYRKGLRYNTWLRYRFTKTNDPFTTGRGLFEYPARDTLSNPWAGPGSSFAFIFYFEREGLRYQPVTSLLTDEHEFEWKSNWRPKPKVAVNLSLLGSTGKNGDLDSLDVKHQAIRPNVALSVTPNSRWFLMGGYTYQYAKSRGPVAIALFDG